jgi:hypothetical protein
MDVINQARPNTGEAHLANAAVLFRTPAATRNVRRYTKIFSFMAWKIAVAELGHVPDDNKTIPATSAPHPCA